MERIKQTPHLTLHGLEDALVAEGVKVSHHAVWTFLRRKGLNFEKTLFVLEQGRADVARRRQRIRFHQKMKRSSWRRAPSNACRNLVLHISSSPVPAEFDDECSGFAPLHFMPKGKIGRAKRINGSNQTS